MNRLLQGDVGTGKTVLAVYALMTCVAHGYQAALMAPTEILAEQHMATLGQVLAASKVRVVRLTGGLSLKERQAALDAVEILCTRAEVEVCVLDCFRGHVSEAEGASPRRWRAREREPVGHGRHTALP